MNTRPEDLWPLTLGTFEGLIDEVRVSRGPRAISLPNRAPLVAMETRVALEESGSVVPQLPAIIDDETDLTYAWSVVSGDAGDVTFLDATALGSEIAFAKRGLFTLGLTVSDGELATTTSDWSVGMNTPLVILVEDKKVTLNFGVMLVPSVVIEDDAWAGATEFVVDWKVVQGDSLNVTFSDPSMLQPTISFADAGDYTLSLMVSAGEFVSDVDFQITVLPKLLPPVIRNSEPQASLQLDGTFTPDLEIADDGPFTYQWTVSHGLTNSVEFSDPTSLTPIIRFTQVGDYELTIRASARGEHATSTIQISVSPVPTLLERWRSTHFLATTLKDSALEASLWGDLADPDGDRRVNLLEAYAGTDPQEPNRDPFLRIRQTDNAIVLEWPRARDPLGLSVKVLASSTLENFEFLMPIPSITVAANESDLEARMPLGQPKGFLALSISETP